MSFNLPSYSSIPANPEGRTFSQRNHPERSSIGEGDQGTRRAVERTGESRLINTLVLVEDKTPSDRTPRTKALRSATGKSRDLSVG